MIPIYYPWTDWEMDFINSNDEWDWKWKKDTPQEIKNTIKNRLIIIIENGTKI